MPIAMHGRTIALAGALLSLALTTATASADETLTTAQPAAHDGVVTSFTLGNAATLDGVRLRSVQALGGGSVTTATSDPLTIGPGERVTLRLPIAQGGTLEVTGASGTTTLQADVEPDGDGDGYGDVTQDLCPNDFTAQVRPCPGTTTVGSPLTLASDPRGFSGSGSPLEALQSSQSVFLDAGVLTRFRLRATPAAGDTVVQVLRPTDSSRTRFTVAAESAPVPATDSGVVTVPASIPVQPGDTLAARSATGDLGAVAYVSGDQLDTQQPPATASNHQSFTTGSHYADRRLLVQADVESDLDGDGKGDATQDHADLQLTGSGPVTAVGANDTITQTLTVRNAGPDPALKVVLSFRTNGAFPDGPAGVACAGGSPYGGFAGSCSVDRLAAGASLTITMSSPAAAIPITGADITTRARADALTGDPDTTNNAATVTSTRAQPPFVYNNPPPAGTQQPFVVIACANVIKGTRDDDVLRGTVFGDRLVGGDGADLLKGDAGDDCLEGGSGNDVLDGGNGDDRLAGDAGSDRLTGGNGNDRLTGGRGNDKLSGGNGNDIISPGAGKDTISGGPGNDTINSVDGVRETVDCGSGRDTVRADRRDHLVHCERITRKR